MAEFPLAGHSEAVTKVLSSILPPKAYAHLSAFLPGFFFEVSVCLANPQLVQKLIARSNEAANLGRYPKILIAVFLAFVLGNAIMLWVGIVKRILGVLFRVSRFLWRRFCAWPLLSVLRYLSDAKALPAADRSVPWLPFAAWFSRAKGWLSHRQWMQKSIQRAQDTAFGRERDSAGVRKLWATLTRSLLKEHYGIGLEPLGQDEWDALYAASSSVPAIQFSDHLLMVASQALGWSGLAATRFAPSLINRDYIALNLFLIAIGLFYQWRALQDLHDEYVFGLLRVRALLSELRNGKMHTGPAKGEPPA